MKKENITQKILQKTISNKTPVNDIFILLGDLNNIVITSTITIITNKLKMLNFPKPIITKAKLITIELLENIIKHQKEEYSVGPYFELSITDKSLSFTAGNCISKDDSIEISNKLDRYKKMSKESIKSTYFETLKNGEIDEHGNAGLGLLTLIKRSEKKYDYRMDEITEKEIFFNSYVNISI